LDLHINLAFLALFRGFEALRLCVEVGKGQWRVRGCLSNRKANLLACRAGTAAVKADACKMQGFQNPTFAPLNRAQVPLKISQIFSLKISRFYPFDDFPIGARLP
jgi:hypothetical protein